MSESQEFFETQDPKYVIINGQLANAFTREYIPEDEPVFILRAKDVNAIDGIRVYMASCQEHDQRENVNSVIQAFESFKDENPDLMSEPDTVILSEFVNDPPDSTEETTAEEDVESELKDDSGE